MGRSLPHEDGVARLRGRDRSSTKPFFARVTAADTGRWSEAAPCATRRADDGQPSGAAGDALPAVPARVDGRTACDLRTVFPEQDQVNRPGVGVMAVFVTAGHVDPGGRRRKYSDPGSPSADLGRSARRNAPKYAAGLLSDGRREVGQVLDGAPSLVLAVEQEFDE